MNESTKKNRAPWAALALSLATPGLGQLYCGRPRKAAALFLVASSLLGPVWIAAAHVPPSTGLLLLMLTAPFGLLALYIYAVADAYRLARRHADDYEPRRYNRTWAYVLFFALGWILQIGVAGAIKEEGFQAFRISSKSMYPNLRPGDFLLANKRILRDQAPQLGDVVVFRDPTDPPRRLVKRVIAAPGDAVEIRDDRVYVNGRMLTYQEEAFAGDVVESMGLYERIGDGAYPILVNAVAGENLEGVRVPDGHYYLLGDNRLHSRDSRQIGTVPREDIILHSPYET